MLDAGPLQNCQQIINGMRKKRDYKEIAINGREKTQSEGILEYKSLSEGRKYLLFFVRNLLINLINAKP